MPPDSVHHCGTQSLNCTGLRDALSKEETWKTMCTLRGATQWKQFPGQQQDPFFGEACHGKQTEHGWLLSRAVVSTGVFLPPSWREANGHYILNIIQEVQQCNTASSGTVWKQNHFVPLFWSLDKQWHTPPLPLTCTKPLTTHGAPLPQEGEQEAAC